MKGLLNYYKSKNKRRSSDFNKLISLKIFKFSISYWFLPFLILFHNLIAFIIKAYCRNVGTLNIAKRSISNQKGLNTICKIPIGITKPKIGMVRKSAGNKRNRYALEILPMIEE